MERDPTLRREALIRETGCKSERNACLEVNWLLMYGTVLHRTETMAPVTVLQCACVAGREEAKRAAAALNSEKLQFDVAYTSVLRRAHESLDIILTEIRQPGLPVVQAWQLNERHYGALTGHNKAEMAAKYGKEQASTFTKLMSRLTD